MELEQVIKRLEWLDDERRKDKTTIATLEDRLANLEAAIVPFSPQIKNINSEITRLTTVLARLDQFEGSLAQMRVDSTRELSVIEKERADHERETEKVRRIEVEGLNRAVAEVRKGLDPIPELRRGLQLRQEEEFRLARLIEEVQAKVIDTHRYDEEYKRSLKLIEEGRRQDTKRIADLQAEVEAMRKRSDEQRGRIELSTDGQRKLDTRLTELLAADNERRQAQIAFIEKQTMTQVEFDRQWKDWQARFELIEKAAGSIEGQVQVLDATNRSVKRSQDSLEEVTQRFDRRINEITEMQRLNEDRFRQEWVTYKADDQKRWTNYTLSQEEQARESGRRFEKVTDRLAVLENVTKDFQDLLQQVTEETQKRLQALLVLAHEWVSAYETAFGKPR
jgi:chromosome segregation ATPase